MPWAPTDGDRIAAWNFLRPRWPWPVIEGAPTGAAWCKAEAVADALSRTDAEILIITDADVWCDGTADALMAVADGAAWAVPHGKVHRLTLEATSTVLATGTFTPGADCAEKPYTGHAGGGIVVLHRTVYESCPLDPRYVGWGQEDDAWALALRCLHGPPWRGDAPLWHFWHQPQPRQTRRTGSPESVALYRRYQKARRQPERMRALLEEVA